MIRKAVGIARMSIILVLSLLALAMLGAFMMSYAPPIVADWGSSSSPSLAYVVGEVRDLRHYTLGPVVVVFGGGARPIRLHYGSYLPQPLSPASLSILSTVPPMTFYDWEFRRSWLTIAAGETEALPHSRGIQSWSCRCDLCYGINVDVSRWPVLGLAVLFAAYPVIAFFRGPARRRRRRKHGECVTCGYNLTGNMSGVCPECGTKIRAR